MSVAFIAMLYRRRSLRGQSPGIALCKMLGTGMASLAFLVAPFPLPPALLPFLSLSIFIYDALYVVMVFMAQYKSQWLARLFASAGGTPQAEKRNPRLSEST